MTTKDHTISLIRCTCRTVYSLQRQRIQTGNRVAAAFRTNLGIGTVAATEDEFAKEQRSILIRLRKSHRRITDAIARNNESIKGALTRLQITKGFTPDDLITKPAELFLVDSYLRFLEIEEQHFKDMALLLEELPIYTTFLKDIPGMGPAMAGVIVSEIDIHKATNPSSLWRYVGLDTVQVVEIPSNGTTTLLSLEQAFEHPDISTDDCGNFMYKGVRVEQRDVGRNASSYSLVTRQYTDKSGNTTIRRSLSHSRFCKTKLTGVLGGSLLKASTVYVNGRSMGGARRLELAESLGMETADLLPEDRNGAVIEFLKERGYQIVCKSSKYATCYHDYKRRLKSDPKHRNKTPSHQHAMAVRYMVKQLLADLYTHWRTLEGLPVSTSYAEGKLGMVHGEVKPAPLLSRRAASLMIQYSPKYEQYPRNDRVIVDSVNLFQTGARSDTSDAFKLFECTHGNTSLVCPTQPAKPTNISESFMLDLGIRAPVLFGDIRELAAKLAPISREIAQEGDHIQKLKQIEIDWSAKQIFVSIVDDLVRLLNYPPVEAREVLNKEPFCRKTALLMKSLGYVELDVLAGACQTHTESMYDHLRKQLKQRYNGIYSSSLIGPNYVLVNEIPVNVTSVARDSW